LSLTDFLEQWTYFGVALVLFVAGLGVPIPEDIPLIFGGVLAGRDPPIINVWVHFAVSMTFILIGDSCLYYIGRRWARSPVPEGRAARVLNPARKAQVEAYFAKYGMWTVFFGRFVAGIRGAVFLSAGVSGFSYARFLLMDTLAALLTVPIWIWLGMKWGENWEAFLDVFKKGQIWVLAAVAAAAVGGFIYWRIKRRRAAQPPA
jgi:membrane protein DedA with SNARE-associated domain